MGVIRSMSKTFEKRISKKNRKKKDLVEELGLSLELRELDNALLKGADLEVVRLSKIEVRSQVRTKFNDKSLLELSENIKENGLIQPLVIHEEGDKFVLICGERRYRAMGMIDDMIEAPCFVLRNKTKEELLAIQFSENSAREDLHYIDQADSIYQYRKVTGASERKIVAALGVSKSEVHRSLLIGRLPKSVKEAAKKYNIEKYVLLEWDAQTQGSQREKIRRLIAKGDLRKRSQLKKILSGGKLSKPRGKTSATRGRRKKQLSASLFIKTLKKKSRDMELDEETQKILSQLVKETRDVIEV